MLLIQVHRSDDADSEQPEYLSLVSAGNNKILMHSESYVAGNGMRAALDLREEIPDAEVQDLREAKRADAPPEEEPETDEERERREQARQQSDDLTTAREGARDAVDADAGPDPEPGG